MGNTNDAQSQVPVSSTFSTPVRDVPSYMKSHVIPVREIPVTTNNLPIPVREIPITTNTRAIPVGEIPVPRHSTNMTEATTTSTSTHSSTMGETSFINTSTDSSNVKYIPSTSTCSTMKETSITNMSIRETPVINTTFESITKTETPGTSTRTGSGITTQTPVISSTYFDSTMKETYCIRETPIVSTNFKLETSVMSTSTHSVTVRETPIMTTSTRPNYVRDTPIINTNVHSNYMREPPFISTSTQSNCVRQPQFISTGNPNYVGQPPFISTSNSNNVGQPPFISTNNPNHVGQPPFIFTSNHNSVGQPPFISTTNPNYVGQPPFMSTTNPNYVGQPPFISTSNLNYVRQPPFKSTNNPNYVGQPPFISTSTHLRETPVSNTSTYFTTNFPVKMDKHYDELLLELECPICSLYMTPPIRQCATGHSICASCQSKLPGCPICQEKFTDSKNLTLEALARKMRYPCVNQTYGCRERLTLEERAMHERLCTFKCYRCAQSKCKWVGKHQDILSHWNGKKLSSRPYRQTNICHTKKTEAYYVNMIQAYNSIFWYKFKSCGGRLQWSVQFIGPNENANDYYFEIELFKPNQIFRRTLLSEYCQPVDIENDMLFKPGCSVMTTVDAIRPYFGDDDLLIFYMRVKECNSSTDSAGAHEGRDSSTIRAQNLRRDHSRSRESLLGDPMKPYRGGQNHRGAPHNSRGGSQKYCLYNNNQKDVN